MSFVDQEKVERARFGFEVDDFLNGKIGQYLQLRADAEIHAAHLGLEDAADPQLIKQLQTKIHVARQWRAWLAEAVHDGQAAAHEAEQELDQRR